MRRDWVQRTADDIHRALAGYGEDATAEDIQGLLDTPVANSRLYRALEILRRSKMVEVQVARSRQGRPVTRYRLSEEGRGNVPEPGAYSEIGAHGPDSSRNAPSLHPGDPTDFRNQPHVAPGGPITKHEGHPLLMSLQNRYDIRTRLFETARMLPAEDPLATEMRERGKALTTLTPVEEEYLRYADRHKERTT